VTGNDIEETLRRSYEALNRGEIDRCLAVLAPDAVWRESPELPGIDEVRGREAIRDFLCEFLEPWDDFHQEVEDVRVEGQQAALLLHLTAVGRQSGVEVDTRYAHLWTMREGLGECVDAYRDQAEALRALAEASGSGREANTP
jgi:ketosteroid isomerase-like protein